MSKKLIYFIVLYTLFLNSIIFAQTNETIILPYTQYMERIKNLIPEMKLTASQESNAANNLTKAKSSGDVKFDFAKVFHGLQMQLIIYMNAMLELYEKKGEKRVIPAGMFYFHINTT